MDSTFKMRLINFIGELEFTPGDPLEAEAGALYGILTRKPGRQPGYSPKRAEGAALLAASGPDGKELSE